MGVIRQVLLSGLLAMTASAQDPFAVPFSERAPAVQGDVLTTAALGLADDRFRLMSARRDGARDAARVRGIAALHRFADDALARARVAPACAARAHGAIDAYVHVDGTRSLVDGSAIVVVSVGVDRLSTACAAEGLPWTR
jgi:hypothetical protein